MTTIGNWMKTGLFMAGIMALFGVVGAMLGGGRGMLLALAIAAAMNLWTYWFSDTMVLRLYRAREVDAHSAPQLVSLVRKLATRANLPMPRVYVIDEAQPNAFATGRNPEHAAVAATTGILQLLSARELRGVLAHELSHIAHRDILTSTITASIAGAISTLANFGMFFGGRDDDRNPVLAIAVMIVAPIAAMLIQFAISRSREYEADRGGAGLSGDPRALADALVRIDGYVKGGVALEAAEAHPATAQMMIVNPLTGSGLAGLFSTHPPIEERVRRLFAMAR